MQDSELDIISAFKFQKRLQFSVAINLSLVLLLIIFALVKIDMSAELQQALVVILGLVVIAALDAFQKTLDNQSLPVLSSGNQIIIRDGGIYVGGDYVGGSINNATESRQTLAEAAVEIHNLLQKLNELNPTATEDEKIAYVNDEVAPAFKSRVASAVRATGEVEAAIEIQEILEQMEEAKSVSQQDQRLSDMQIKPSLKFRVLEALKAGSELALEEVLSNNIYARVAQAVIEGWVSPIENNQSYPQNDSDENN